MVDLVALCVAYVLGWGTVLAYALTAVMGFSCLKKLSPVEGFSNYTLSSGLLDCLRMISPLHSAKLVEDGRGWAMIWFGVAILAFTSVSFSLMHVGYVMSTDIMSVGVTDSVKWFLNHIIRCIGTSVIIYGAAHGARNYLN